MCHLQESPFGGTAKLPWQERVQQGRPCGVGLGGGDGDQLIPTGTQAVCLMRLLMNATDLGLLLPMCVVV